MAFENRESETVKLTKVVTKEDPFMKELADLITKHFQDGRAMLSLTVKPDEVIREVWRT